MTEEFQPDPDQLLKAIQKEEAQKQLGKLKIFFGMSAGVGKTYAMLEEARRLLKENINVVAGTINTHGRKETEELLVGMPIIPEKWVNYRDVVFEEMDLETILKLKPAIVLVDELAHTNVPGSRHSKRWQDVIEILDAGIDVYTTLNVQHLESRKDLVESITGIQIRETVPDSILERASTIELIDISPSVLLQRLKEGKVYLGMQSQIAAKNFFREDTLMALREIALRFTAEKVDHDLHTFLSPGKGWKTREKLMVGVSSNPDAQKLIRITRRRAFELDAPWVAVYVDTGLLLSEENKTQLTNNLNLAQELGGEVFMTKDTDIATALQRVARQKNITQVVIGRRTTRSIKDYFQKSLIDRLGEESKQFDLFIIRQETPQKASLVDKHRPRYFSSPFREYVWGIISVLIMTVLNYLLMTHVEYKAIGFVYLIGIVFLSHFLGQGPMFLVALLSTICWHMFTPPVIKLSMSVATEAIFVSIFFFTTMITGLLLTRLRKQEIFLKNRERKLENLYEIEREIASASNLQNLRRNVCLHLQSIFKGKFDILVKDMNSPIQFETTIPQSDKDKEIAALEWVFENGKTAGWSTATLPYAKGLYIPLKFSQKVIGVLSYYPKDRGLLSIEELNFLQSIAQQLGIYLERHLFEEQMLAQNYAVQLKKIQESVLQSISKTFFTPLNTIDNALHELSPSSEKEHHLISIIEESEKKLKHLIDNFISSSEVESGFLQFKLEDINIKQFVENVLVEIKTLIPRNSIELNFKENHYHLSIDPRLIKLSIANLLLSISHYSKENSVIKIEGFEKDKFLNIKIYGSGEPFKPEFLEKVFDKFNPNFENPYQDVNFNLSITKAIMDIHKGEIKAYNIDQNSIAFEIILPLKIEST
ncbi:MAG: DUF4118 domain-containing protein [Parachlamydiaceae bacterium]|nr:DUF4118 domain-containing protein [Parachlamydiaceae bacterium]